MNCYDFLGKVMDCCLPDIFQIQSCPPRLTATQGISVVFYLIHSWGKVRRNRFIHLSQALVRKWAQQTEHLTSFPLHASTGNHSCRACLGQSRPGGTDNFSGYTTDDILLIDLDAGTWLLIQLRGPSEVVVDFCLGSSPLSDAVSSPLWLYCQEFNPICRFSMPRLET